MEGEKKIIWSAHAAKDLGAVFDYVFADNSKAAANLYDEIWESTLRLKRHCLLGRIVPELNELSFRELLVGEYRIIYSVLSAEIRVLRVLHSRQLFRL